MILVTEPAPTARVPIKVVPIYIDEVVVSEPVEVPDAPAPRVLRPKTPLIGAVAVGIAVLAGLLQGVAIVVATSGDFLPATVLGYLAVGLAILAMVGGVVAIVLNRGRRLGVVAVIVGVLANPLVLLWILRGVTGLVG